MRDEEQVKKAVDKVVNNSREPIKIVIELYPNGRLEATFPGNAITALGMLELAKRMVGSEPPRTQKNIVVPSIGTKRPM